MERVDILKKFYALLMVVCLLLVNSANVFADETNESKVVSVSASNYHTLFLKDDGTVWSVGKNDSGQLGDGSTISKVTPIKISNLNHIRSIYASDNFSMALSSDGDLYSWGENFFGQLGVGNYQDTNVPQLILKEIDSIGILAGRQIFALTKNKELFTWGDVEYHPRPLEYYTFPNPHKVDVYSNIKELSSFFLISEDGKTLKSEAPNNLNLIDMNFNNAKKIINYINTTSFGLKNDGTVWINTHEKDFSSSAQQNVFYQIDSLSDVIDIDAREDYVFALKSDQTLWSMGKNNFGQLGIGKKTNFESSPIEILSNVKSFSSGSYYTYAVLNDGSIWKWGFMGLNVKNEILVPTKIFDYIDFLSPIKIIVNNTEISFDIAPFIENGYTMVPLRAIFENLGAMVNWDDNTKTVTATKGNTILILSIGSHEATINGHKTPLEQPSEIVNGSTMVPVRFISEALGAKVDYNEKQRTVLISQ